MSNSLKNSFFAKTMEEKDVDIPKETKKQSTEVGTKETKKQSTEETISEDGTNINVNVALKTEATTSKVRYASYLRPDTIKRIKLEALMNDKNEYQLIQEILDKHFKVASR